jgi:uncharacterized protein (UPF0297 family)
MQREIDLFSESKAFERYTKPQIEELKPIMRTLLSKNPDGIVITELYKTLEEQGYDFNVIQSTFLELSSTDALYLGRNNEKHTTVLVTNSTNSLI